MSEKFKVVENIRKRKKKSQEVEEKTKEGRAGPPDSRHLKRLDDYVL